MTEIKPKPESTEETKPEDAEKPEEKPSMGERLFGWIFGESVETDAQNAEDDKPKEGGEAIETRLPTTPIFNQKRATRSQPDFTPVSVTFMTGTYRGKSIELGVSINEVSISQTANWEELAQSNLKQGLTFKNLSPQTISFEAVFHSTEHDISHLAENLKHLQEINSVKRAIAGITPMPPLLMLDIGSQKIFCVCKELSLKYEHPFTGKKGYQLCTASLSFTEYSEKSTASSLGRPNTGTPLLHYKQTTTEEERQRVAQIALISDALFTGRTGEAAEKQKELVQEIIKDEALQNVERLKELDSETFVNLVMAGGVAPNTLKDPEISKKLREDLASVYVENMGGLATADPRMHRMIKEALIDPAKATEYASLLPENFSQIKSDFELIHEVVSTQNLSTTSTHRIFTNNKEARARNILLDIGGRSLEYRQANLFGDIAQQAEVQITIGKINTFVSENSNDKNKLIESLGLSSDQQARIIINRAPFDSEHELKEALSVLNGQTDKDGNKISANTLYERLVKAATTQPEDSDEDPEDIEN